MSYLSKVTTEIVHKAPILTIIAPPGAGKTTLAATFPKAIFIRGEDGSAALANLENKPAMFPLLINEQSPRMAVLHMIGELLTQEHEFKTLVFDAVTSMNILFERELAKRDNVQNVVESCGGFQKCYDELKAWHLKIFEGCERLRNEKGMTIVFLAHTEIRNIKNSPEESSNYSVWAMDMHHKPSSIYINNSDAVIYMVKEKFVTGVTVDRKGNQTSKGRVTESGDRKLITSSDGQTGFISAKNRFDLPTELEINKGENPLLNLIPFFNSQA